MAGGGAVYGKREEELQATCRMGGACSAAPERGVRCVQGLGSRDNVRRSARAPARRPISVSSTVASSAVWSAPGDVGAGAGGADHEPGTAAVLTLAYGSRGRGLAGAAWRGPWRAAWREPAWRRNSACGRRRSSAAAHGRARVGGASGGARLPLRRCGRVLGNDPITPGWCLSLIALIIASDGVTAASLAWRSHPDAGNRPSLLKRPGELVVYIDSTRACSPGRGLAGRDGPFRRRPRRLISPMKPYNRQPCLIAVLRSR